MDLHRFSQLADDLAQRIPPRLLEGLNGGIVIKPDTLRNSGDPLGVYILGQYMSGGYLGAYIALYFGSFQAVFAGQSTAVWEEELWNTIRHELRHHIEAQAGVRDLEVEDARQIAALHHDYREQRRLERLQRMARRMRRQSR